MPRKSVSQAYRLKVVNRAMGRCEYCQSAESLSIGSFHVDHVVPLAHKGLTRLENLAYCCPGCNNAKWSKIKSKDPKTNRLVNLFNPRQQTWEDHFRWNSAGTRIEGKTSCGRATVEALDMNRPRLVQLRQIWVRWGEHPPKE
jgi:5-methylcytosine-specific restriction endonuclease McrA